MKTSEQIDELVKALVKARMKFDKISKSSENPHFKSKYAPLNEIIEAVAVPLAEEGLILTGGPEPQDDGSLLVVSRLIHTSGQWIENSMRIERDKIQQMGSGITYARRYTAAPLLGVAAEDDDDGNAAQQTRMPLTKERRSSPRPAPEEVSQDPADVHPDREQVDVLISLGKSAVGSNDGLLRHTIRDVMGVSEAVEITKKFLREQMDMWQYAEATGRFNAMIKQHVEADVDDFQPPDRLSASAAGEPTGQESYATPDQIARLKLLAQQVGDDAYTDVQDMLEHHPAGLTMEVYDIVSARLKARKEAKVSPEMIAQYEMDAKQYGLMDVATPNIERWQQYGVSPQAFASARRNLDARINEKQRQQGAVEDEAKSLAGANA